ncbi:MAG: hypothetical protein JWM59_1932 [Verrucomicrobiales bacterium]|nr:hypothetical protein [Verrucomicrobiales bacterium]
MIRYLCFSWRRLAVVLLPALALFSSLTGFCRAEEPAASTSPLPPAQVIPITHGQRVFTVGNSFHAWFIAPILQDLAEKAGIKNHIIVGVSKIGGSKAIQHWDIPDDKNEAKAALRAGKVDVLTLASMLHPDEDEGIAKFAELASAHNPGARVILQEFWLPWDRFEWPLQGNEADVDPEAATVPMLEALHAPYFAAMDAYVRALNEKLGRPVVYIAPVGQCVVELREKLIAGQAPGLSKQAELFTDKLGHPQAAIEALSAYCNFAIIYRRSPVGLPMPEVLAKAGDPKWRNPELNRLLQEIAWRQLTKHPLTGLSTSTSAGPSPAGEGNKSKVSAAAETPGTGSKTMEGKVYTGYQGWFTPLRKEDNARWVHYGSRGKFEPGFSSVEMWPDTSDLDADEKVETGFRNADGGVAHVFDSQNPKTVSRHFDWMRQYGIDGAFLQRFVEPAANATLRPHLDRVLAGVRGASKTHGVEWGLMYDLSGVRAQDIFPNVSGDWKRMAGEGGIRSDPHYIHHRGKPVVVLWGIGFSDNRPAPGACLSLVQFLKNDPVYGGNTVILGVPFYWRTGKNDAVSDSDLEKVILAADVIAPWPVGRYADPDGAVNLAKHERAPDAAWASKHGLDYLPGIFPGFSWSNLMQTRRQKGRFNQIPRLGGQFLWTQAVSSKRAGAKMLYVAMFDEIDEGTAIFKVSNTPPAGETPFVTYDGLPADHYLWLTGEIGKMLRGAVLENDEMPKR